MANQNFTLGQGLGSKNPSRLINNINSIYGGKTVRISPRKVVKNPKNKYNIDDVTELANVIAMYGLIQPLVVKGPFPDGTYMLVGGERRWTAVLKILDEYEPEYTKYFKEIEIKVVGPHDMDEIDEKILIIELNEQGRDMSQYRVQDIWDLHKLYTEKQNRGDKMPINIVRIISEKLGIGERQVQKYVSIEKKMIPEMKEVVGSRIIGDDDKGKSGQKILSINKAAAISQLPKEKQKEVHQIIKETGSIDDKTIQRLKNEVHQKDDDLSDVELKDAVIIEKNKEYEEQEEPTMFLGNSDAAEDIPEDDDSEDSSYEDDDAVEIVEDTSEVFYETSTKIAKEKQEKEFITKVLGWMRTMNDADKLENYQKDAVVRIKELADSILL